MKLTWTIAPQNIRASLYHTQLVSLLITVDPQDQAKAVPKPRILRPIPETIFMEQAYTTIRGRSPRE